jgi:hypothetical protein
MHIGTRSSLKSFITVPCLLALPQGRETVTSSYASAVHVQLLVNGAPCTAHNVTLLLNMIMWRGIGMHIADKC